MSSDILNQMQDLKSQMDQFRLYLQIQQGRADDYKAQVENKAKILNQSQQLRSPLRFSHGIDKSRTTPRKPPQKKNFYTPINMPTVSSTPKTKKKEDLTNLLSSDESSSDEEIDLLLKEHRKGSTSQSPFKKYHFSSDSKTSMSKYSISTEPSEKGSIKDDLTNSDSSTEISKDEIIFSDSSDSSDSTSFLVQSSQSDTKTKSRYNDNSSNKVKILRSMKLVDEVMSESDRKRKKVSKFKLKISKSFAVPYSGSYEEGEVYKIEEDDNSIKKSTDTDSDVEEFENFVPPVADEFQVNQNSNNNSNLNENSEEVKHGEGDIIQIKDIPDVDIPSVDLNFLKDDEKEEKNEVNESDKDSINALFGEMQTICTILDNEEESE